MNEKPNCCERCGITIEPSDILRGVSHNCPPPQQAPWEERWDEKFGGTLETVKANSGVIKSFISSTINSQLSLLLDRVRRLKGQRVKYISEDKQLNTEFDIALSEVESEIIKLMN